MDEAESTLLPVHGTGTPRGYPGEGYPGEEMGYPGAEGEMGYPDEAKSWWATDDFPVHKAPRAAFLVDGRMTMLEMCLHFLSATQTIHIAAWGLSPELLLVRGKHHRAGADGSAEQQELLTWLRAKGLTEPDLIFWQQCEELSVKNVLSYAVAQGITVRVLLWNTYTLPFQPSPKQVQETLEEIGVYCLLDDSHMGLFNHPTMAHHQKTVVVDNTFAFIGGIDMMMQSNGEYDRWDTKGHPYHHPLRIGKDGKMPHSWHDVHILFEGSAVADVEQNFRQRWNALVNLHEMDPLLILPEPMAETSVTNVAGNLHVQVTRTIPNGMYTFVPEGGIATILETYKNAFALAKCSIYLENQYFWRRTFLGVENPAMGLPHADMEQLWQSLADALERGVVVTMLVPDNPNVGREFTDDGLQYLWSLAPRAVASGTLQVYTLGCSTQKGDSTLYRSIYVHAKVAIVDDEWMTVGSANLNNRGMRDDTEMNVALAHARLAKGLRILLMAEHLGLCNEDELFQIIEAMGRVQLADERDQVSEAIGSLWTRLQALLGDPFSGMALFAKQAKENLLAVKAGQPLVGHLLPYISSGWAHDYEVTVNSVNGWLTALPNNS